MDTVRLGTSDLVVPRLCLGTMYFGTSVLEAEAHGLLDLALDRGATFLDTANNYAFWVDGGTGDESELTIGRWLSARGPGVRDRLTLATKIGARPRPGTASLDGAMGLSASAVREQAEDSLCRLGVDHVDLLYAHIDDRTTPLAETVQALGELVEAGLTRAIGGSNLSPARLRDAVEASGDGPGRYVALQQRATYLRPAPGADFTPHVHLDDDMELTAAQLGVTVLGYSPLAGGSYTRTDRPLPDGYIHDRTGAQLAALEDAATQLNLDRGQVVFAWLMAKQPPVLPVAGFSTRAQLDQAIDAAEASLDARTLAALDAARG